jgi:hypothetical protein
MALWHNSIDNSIHDDMNGEALLIPAWPQGMTQITQAQADALLAPPPLTSVQQRDTIQAQIDAMEQKNIMPRLTREYMLTDAVKQAAAIGITEPQLYALQIGYKRLKDFDSAISVLRVQRDAIV